MHILKVILIYKVCLLRLGIGFILPRSPCPSIFHYEWMDRPQKYNDLPLKGVITITSSVPILLKVKMHIPAALFTEYTGRLEVAERKAEPDQRISSGSLEKVKYNLYYPKSVPMPQIILIEVNNKVLCSSNPVHRPIKTTVNWEHFLRPNSLATNDSKGFSKLGGRSDDSEIQNSFEDEIRNPTQSIIQEAKTEVVKTESTEETCGKPIRVLPLVVGGAQARRGDWPWMVPLFERTELGVQFRCGATLISNQFIVTAAHCLIDEDNVIAEKDDLIAYIGKFNIKNWVEGNTQPREISEIYIHPDYDADTLYSDLALLKLKTKVKTSRFVNPACIWNEEDDLNSIVGAKGLIFGWGMDDSGFQFTDKPNLAIMPIVSQEECLRSNPELIFWTSDRTFCAGSKNGTGPCTGDSGAGVLLPRKGKDGVNRWYLRGILSLSVIEDSDRSVKCNLDEYVVFTDVAKYKTWISDVLLET